MRSLQPLLHDLVPTIAAPTTALSGPDGQIRPAGVQGEGEGAQVVPPPIETVNIYGDVFGQIAVIAIVSSLICFAMSPILRKWMHAEAEPPH